MDRCSNCDIDLGISPLMVRGKTYCCAGCADGGPCRCSYEKGNSRQHRNGHSDPVISELLFLDADTTRVHPDSPAAN